MEHATRPPVKHQIELRPGLAELDTGAIHRCPLCLGELVPVSRAGARPGASGVVRHRRRANDAQCVLTTHAYQPDELVVHQQRNVVVARDQRQRFMAHWPHHYAAAQRALPSLTIRRFTTVIACADVLNLWSYRELREEDLPYVLLVMAGFIRVPDVGDGAQGWVRFWFDASVHDVGDLWKPRPLPPGLFRVTYASLDVAPLPTGAQVLGWTEVVREEDILGGPRPDLSRDKMDEFRRFVARDREGLASRGG